MQSIDTNILARLVLADDARQAEIAIRILDQPSWVGVTVALELWWVLTTAGRLTRRQAAAAFAKLQSLQSVRWQHGEAVAWAAAKASAGADFADMLHLALSGGADSFATFDHRIAAHAQGAPVPVETL